MRRGILAVAMTVASLVATSAQAATPFGSFEGNLNSSLSSGTAFNLGNSTAALNPTPTFVATGATDGATAMRLRLALTFDFGLALTEGSDKTAMRDAFNSNDRLLFDVTVPQILTATGAPDTDGYVVFLSALNSNGTGGGFHQSPSNLPLTDGSGDNAYNKGTVTVAWNYRAQGILFPGDAPGAAGFTQYNLALNAGNFDSAPIAFFDNFRFVTAPEPATLGALAAVGSMLVRRRR